MASPAGIARRAAIAVLLSAPSTIAAQVLASEHGMVAQTVDGTTITVEYYRPVARGRTPFGGVVKWGETWTPGANWATTIEVSKDVTLNGKPLPKGKYSLWMIPKEQGEWTVIVDKKARLYHTSPPKTEADDQLRFAVKPELGPPTEVLTWSFPSVLRDGMALRMQWGPTYIPLQIGVQPTRPIAVTAEERAAYVGKWDVSFDAADGQPAMNVKMELFDTPDGLRGRMIPSDPGADSLFDFVPSGPKRFHPGMYQNGKFVGVELDWTFVFTLQGNRATSFEMLGESEQPIGRGKRSK